MFVGTITENTKPTGTLTNLNETGNEANFDGTVTGIEGSGTFKSFAPASAFATGYKSGNIGVTLAEVQKPSSLTIDEACDILVAKETSYMADATGEVAINDLFFKRMFSVVKVALNGPESLNGEKVSKFSLIASEGTILTGRAAIDLATASIDKWLPNLKNNSVTATYSEDAPLFGGEAGLKNEVWLVVNPGTIESGAKVVFAGETSNYTFSKEVTLSKALTFPESQLAVINLTLAEENCTKKAAASWIATDLADITATDEVVITMAKDGAVYAMTSDNGTKNPSAVAVVVKDGKLSTAPAENLVWNIANDKGNLIIYPKGQTDKWLCSVSGQTNVKVDNSTTCNKFTLDLQTKYLKNTGTNRYLGVYKTTDWRAYASATGTSAIAGQTLCFYVKSAPIDNTIPTLSVDQMSKVWAADAIDAFVVNVAVNSEGGDWTVTPETLSWATIKVDKAAGTITITPNGANETETANEATLTVSHASDASLTKEISLKQDGKGSAANYFVKVTTAPTDWSGKYLIVFGNNAHSYVNVAKNGKDLISKNTVALSIIGDQIVSNETVNADMVEISKTTNGYKILLSDGKYLSVPKSNACSSNTTGSVFTISLGKTGVSISGKDSSNATRTLCRNGEYYRMYTNVGSYTLPQLYKLAN